MKRFLFIYFLFISACSFGQKYQGNDSYGFNFKRLKSDSTLHIPTFCGAPTLRGSVIANQAAIGYDSCNNRFYVYNPKTAIWKSIGNIDSIHVSNDSVYSCLAGVFTFLFNKFDTSKSYTWTGSQFFNNPINKFGLGGTASYWQLVGATGDNPNWMTQWEKLSTGDIIDFGLYTPNAQFVFGGTNYYPNTGSDYLLVTYGKFSKNYVDANNLGFNQGTVAIGNAAGATVGAMLDIYNYPNHRALPSLRFNYQNSDVLKDTLVSGAIEPYKDSLYFTNQSLQRKRFLFAGDVTGNSGTVTSIATSNGILGGTITSSGNLSLDTGYVANYFPRRKDSLTTFATPTALNQKATNWFNILKYGASPSNTSAQNTTDINNAIAAALAVNGTVYIPYGTYLVDSLTWDTRVQITGDGSGSILKSNSAVTLLSYNGNAGYFEVANETISNIVLDGNGIGTIGLSINKGNGWNVENVVIRNFKTEGVYMFNSYTGIFKNCFFQNDVNGIFLSGCNLVTFNQCIIDGNKGVGLVANSCAHIILNSNDLEANGTAGNAATGAISMNGTTSDDIGLSINDTWFEVNNGVLVNLGTPAGHPIYNINNSQLNLSDTCTQTILMGNSANIQYLNITNSTVKSATITDISILGSATTVTTTNSLIGSTSAAAGSVILIDDNNGHYLNGTSTSGISFHATNHSSTSYAGVNLVNDIGNGLLFFKNGSTASSYKNYNAGDAVIYNATNNLAFLNDNGTGNINFAIGLSTPILTLKSNNATIGTSYFSSGTGQLGVNTLTPDPSSIFDAESTTEGVLLTPMSTTQWNAIGSKHEGLQAYDNVIHKPVWYDGTTSRYPQWTTDSLAAGLIKGVISTSNLPSNTLSAPYPLQMKNSNPAHDSIILQQPFIDSVKNSNPLLRVLKGLGSNVLATVGTGVRNNSGNMTSGTVYLSAIYLAKADTITGAKITIGTNGTFNAGNYNGIGLYSVNASTGIYTLVDSTANDTTLYKNNSFEVVQKPFVTTYIAAAGVYMIGALYTSTSQTTAPALYNSNSEKQLADNLPLGMQIGSTLSGQTYLPTSITATATSGASLFYYTIYK